MTIWMFLVQDCRFKGLNLVVQKLSDRCVAYCGLQCGLVCHLGLCRFLVFLARLHIKNFVDRNLKRVKLQALHDLLPTDDWQSRG